jgi:hypothetical protein
MKKSNNLHWYEILLTYRTGPADNDWKTKTQTIIGLYRQSDILSRRKLVKSLSEDALKSLTSGRTENGYITVSIQCYLGYFDKDEK